MPEDGGEITGLLHAWSQGDPVALDTLMAVLQRELHRLATTYLRRERAGHTLEPTALVHELYLRLVGGFTPRWQDRAHFIAIAARQMRQILVDHARRRRAARRAPHRITFTESLFPGGRSPDLLELSDALDALATLDERKARAVELCYFGGLTQEEMAEVLGVHVNTVARDLRFAEAWLRKQLA